MVVVNMQLHFSKNITKNQYIKKCQIQKQRNFRNYHNSRNMKSFRSMFLRVSWIKIEDHCGCSEWMYHLENIVWKNICQCHEWMSFPYVMQSYEEMIKNKLVHSCAGRQRFSSNFFSFITRKIFITAKVPELSRKLLNLFNGNLLS